MSRTPREENKTTYSCDSCGKVLSKEDCICAVVAGRSGLFCSTPCMWEPPLMTVLAPTAPTAGGRRG